MGVEEQLAKAFDSVAGPNSREVTGADLFENVGDDATRERAVELAEFVRDEGCMYGLYQNEVEQVADAMLAAIDDVFGEEATNDTNRA